MLVDTSRLDKFILLGGQGSDVTIMATDFEEVPWRDWEVLTLAESREPAPVVFPRYIGLVSYSSHAGDGGAGSRLFHIREAFVRNNATGTNWQASRLKGRETFSRLPAVPAPTSANESLGLTLIPTIDDNHYQELVGEVLRDIRSGRYYQLNLLRYFDVAEPPAKDWIADRLLRLGGPMAAWLKLPDFEVVSFSPERFVRIDPDRGDLKIMACPIKGTARPALDPQDDARVRHELLADIKCRAELSIIVDLLRHDLHQVSIPHSVVVSSPLELHSYPSVHHLSATIEARLRSGLTGDALWRGLAPGGSITGAPKKEVMAAIRAYEKRPRDYFMGSIFYWDPGRGRLDSSLLIRTLVKDQNQWQYAAGSGLVVGSDPVLECAEIATKCNVITANYLN